MVDTSISRRSRWTHSRLLLPPDDVRHSEELAFLVRAQPFSLHHWNLGVPYFYASVCHFGHHRFSRRSDLSDHPRLKRPFSTGLTTAPFFYFLSKRAAIFLYISIRIKIEQAMTNSPQIVQAGIDTV